MSDDLDPTDPDDLAPDAFGDEEDEAPATPEAPPPPKMKYRCAGCGYKAVEEWMGRCPGHNAPEGAKGCGGYFDCVKIGKDVDSRTHGTLGAQKGPPKIIKRLSTGFPEFDRLLGGDEIEGYGIVPGAVILFVGPPGLGKTTLLAKVCDNIAKGKRRTLYGSGEQAKTAIERLARRIKIENDNIEVLGDEQSLDKILYHASQVMRPRPRLLVIDSVQKVAVDAVEADYNSARAGEAVGNMVTSFARQTNCAVILVNQETKEGNPAGALALQHAVDAVLYFKGYEAFDEEGRVDSDFDSVRVISVPEKNRDGKTGAGVVAYLEMTDEGLKSPSRQVLRKLTKLALV